MNYFKSHIKLGLIFFLIIHVSPFYTHVIAQTNFLSKSFSSPTINDTWTGNISTDWDDVSNWLSGSIPDMYTNVTVPGAVTYYPEIADYAICNAIDINPTGLITININADFNVIDDFIIDGTCIIVGGVCVIGGDFINNGTFNHNNGIIWFDGIIQSIGGTAQIFFNSIIIGSGSTTTINNSSGNTLSGILKVDGVLDANNNLKLLSSSVQTALIDGSGGGNITGNITLQRYLSTGFGYRYFSSPFVSVTTDVFSSIVGFSSDFPPIYAYDENRESSGWVSHSDPLDIFDPLHGYAINFGSVQAPITYDITGVVNNGSLSAISLYNHNQTYTTGFNLIGNPYPSPIDWEASNGWSRTNIDDAIYYFNPSPIDQYGGTYSSYINGISSDDVADGIISSMQGFFIHVTDGSYPVSATIATDNDVRINDLSPTYHKKVSKNSNTLLRLSASFYDEIYSGDPLVICFDELSSQEFEKDRDALKIMNSDNNIPSLYSVSSDNFKLSICSIPYSSDSITIIPLGLEIEIESMVYFHVRDIELFPLDKYVYLFDKVSGVYHDLTKETSYEIYLTIGVSDDRFSLVFSKKEIENSHFSDNMFYAYCNRNTIFVQSNTPYNSETIVCVTDISGRRIWDGVFSEDETLKIDLNIAQGLYILSVNSTHGFYSKKLIISK